MTSSIIPNHHPAPIDLDDDDPFEIFDPRGLFSPQPLPPSSNQLSLDLGISTTAHSTQTTATPIPPASTTNTSTHHSLLTTIPSSNSDSPNSLEHSLSLGFSHRPWSLDPPLSDPTSNLEPQPQLTQAYHSSTRFRSPPSPTLLVSKQKIPQQPLPQEMSPIDSPISPCSSLPYCRSPPASLSMSQSLSLTRGRSPPARFSNDPLSPQLGSASSSSSPSPPHRPTFPNQSHFSQTRTDLPFSHHHRPAPIVTSGIRDLSLPSRICNLRSSEPPGSISSLAYSDMAASPAVNFLSAFADATLPTARTEMSPVATVPAEVLEEGDQVADYILGPIIGRGGFSVVREARHSATNKLVAVKIVKRAPPSSVGQESILSRSSTAQPVSLHASINSRDRSSSFAFPANRHLVNSAHLPLPTSATEDLANALLKQEIRIWSSLRDHPNIVPMLSLHETFSQTLLFMPICEGGNLLQLVNQVKLNPSEQDSLCRDFHWISADPVSASSPRPSDPPLSVGCLRLDLVRFIFWQIVQGLKYLHVEAGIIHKDIKLENILIQKGKVKISDFGLATYPYHDRPVDAVRPVNGKSSSSWNRDLSLPKHFSALPRIAEGLAASGANARVATWSRSHHCRPRLPPTLDNSLFLSQPVIEDEDSGSDHLHQSPLNMFPTAAGSLAYTPPEQLRSEIPLACPSLDIWALGCVLYGLLEGNLPFQDDFEPRLRLKIMNGQFEFPPALVVNPDQMVESDADNRMMIAKVLKGCLAVDRNARWMIEEIASSSWLAPQRAQVNRPMSDDGQSSDGVFEPASNSKRSNSLTSSLPSAWSIDEVSLNASNRLSIPISPCNEDGMNGSSQDGFSPLPPFPISDVTCTSPPLIRKDVLDLRKLLTTIPSYSSSSRSSVPVNRQLSSQSSQSPDLPPSLGFERIARPKYRDTSHRNHLRMSLSRVSTGSAQSSNSRSRSRNRNTFHPSQ